MTVRSSAGRPADRLDRTTKILIAVLGAAAFAAVLDGTAVTASLVTLGESFQADLATIVWVTSAYLMAAGAALPLVGWASDRFGGRAVFLAGLGLFVGGSLLTATAGNIGSLVAFRVIQGFGGGLLEPAALAVAAALAPPDQVGRVMGRCSLIINVAPVVGPLLGTVLADNGLWRLIFAINLPLGALIVFAALRWVPAVVSERTPTPPDVRGMLLLAPGFVAVLLMVNRWGAGTATVTVVIAGLIGAALLAGYLVHAPRSRVTPVLELRLLRIPAFAAALTGMAGVGFLMYSQLTMLPLLAESRFGQTGLGRGLLTAALGVGLVISMSNAGGWSDRVGPRPLVTTGAVVTSAGLATVAVVQASWPLGAVMAVFVVIGLGFGSVAAPTFASIYRTLAPEVAAQGTTAMFIVVQLFASVGVTVMGLLIDDGMTQTGTVFIVLAAVAAALAVNGLRLPGRAAG
jgi:EmrB/QacA subfamily drug resistance transporter